MACFDGEPILDDAENCGRTFGPWRLSGEETNVAPPNSDRLLVEATASGAFVTQESFEVTLKDGRRTAVTVAYRVLTRDGWRAVRYLHDGYSSRTVAAFGEIHLQTNEGPDP